MHPWEKTYKQNKFKITTLKPSIVVESNKNLFSKGDRVLDIGCGNGRNSIFLANEGCLVDAIDVADLMWVDSLHKDLKENINFRKQDLNDFKWVKSFYNIIILARVIQYIDFDSLESLIKNVSKSLKEKGILFLSYSKSGGIHNRKEIKVPKFIHDLEMVKTLLRRSFREVRTSKGSSTSVHVGYTESIESYDIVCLK